MISFIVLIGSLASCIQAQVVGSAPEAQVGSAPNGNRYIVVFKDGNTPVDSQARALTSSVGRRQSGPAVSGQISFEGFKAVTVDWNDSNALDLLKAHPNTMVVEKEGFASVAATQFNAPWGLGRIDQRNALTSTNPLATSFGYTYNDTAGSASTAWIIDTGLDDTNPQFGGRAKFYKNYDPAIITKDDHGHGTHCAGTIGSILYGVAKNVQLRGIRVCNARGSCPWSWMISGIQDVVNAYKAKKTARITDVINMSLGGSFSSTLNAAVTAATTAGVVFVVSAGNSAANACLYSPASTPSALTVAASDITDTIAYFSNRGACVDVFAPGVSILSTLPKGRTAYWQGTSMAAPHVAGTVALALTKYYYNNVAAVNTFISSNATTGQVKGPINIGTSITPNRLLYSLV